MPLARCRKTVILFSAVIFALSEVELSHLLSISYAESPSAESRLSNAQALSLKGEKDFAFMEFRDIWREYPDHPSGRLALFGAGEYAYSEKYLDQAGEYFRSFTKKSQGNPEDILAFAYLVKCAQAAGDEKAAAESTERLKNALASRGILLLFEESRVIRWVSPAGNRFQTKESVDKAEILCNEVPFLQVELP